MQRADGRPVAWREAGIWALDRLERHLGSDWPGLALQKGSGRTAELPLAPFHVIAYANVLELAVRLELLEGVDGFAKARRAIQRDPRPDQLAHSRMQLEVAAMVLRAAAPTQLEPNPGGRRPPDVAIESPAGTLLVETRAVLTSDAWRADDRWTDDLFDRIRAIERSHGVRCEGEIPERLTDEDRDRLLGAICDRARLIAIGASAPALRFPGTALAVVLASDPPGAGLRGPQLRGDSWARVGPRIAQKAAAAVESGANWLRLDVLEGLWTFTQWATLPLAEKSSALAPLVRAGAGSLHGVVVSSGARLRQGEFADEEVASADGVAALRRCIDPLRVRETLIFAASDAFAAEAEFWRTLYADEPSWLDWALAQSGLGSCRQLFAS